MKRTLLIIAALAAFVSCKKTEQDVPGEDTRISNVEIYKSWTYTPDEFGEFLGSTFDDYCNYISETLPTSALVSYNLSEFVRSHRYIIDEAVAEETGLKVSQIYDKWRILRIDFKYETVSYGYNEPIILSAALIVPAVTIENQDHILEAVSLCPPHMSIDDEFCPTENGTVLMGRVMYNHAVVVPDYQGRGVTAAMTYSCLHTYDHAIQSVDAVLAAKQILSDMGYRYKDGAGLFNVGVSEGGEKSYSIQKRIENDITEQQRQELNLLHTFVANGSIDHVQYVKDKIARVEYSDQETFEEDMAILKNAFECLTEEEKQGYDASILYSTEVLAEDGVTLNADHPVFKVLEEAMERNNISYNWNPGSPLRLVGSNDDTTIKLTSHALPAYEMLKNRPDGSENENVSLNAFNTPIVGAISELIGDRYMLAHIMADMICFVHAIEHEDPSSEEASEYQF